MNASDIYEFLKEKGTWVNWSNTCDQFLFGDPQSEVQKVAVAWMATLPNLKKAFGQGCTLFITHEPLYLAQQNEFGIFVGGSYAKNTGLTNFYPLEEDDVWITKTAWLEEHEMTIFRCHDVWDDFPERGIHGAWAKWLGFKDAPIEQQKFYEVHGFPEISFQTLLYQLKEPLDKLGQECIQYIGDLNQKVSSIGLGTGAITNYRQMDVMGADVLVLTDDGTRLWESGQWAEDTGKPIIIVNHATAEEPGVRELAKYLQTHFPEVEIIPIERGCLYQTM